jgi:uncharacterized damage-inducible protein DinB
MIMANLESIKEFAELGFTRLDSSIKDLTEEQLDWTSCSQANTIRNILTHLISEWYGFLPKAVAGDKNAIVKGVPEGYVGNKELKLEKILADLRDGKAHLRSELSKVKEEDLAKEMEWFMGKKPRGFYLMMAVSEIIHHEGQIAAIRGVEKRIKGL